MQALIDKIDGGQQGVDLVKIGQSFAQQGNFLIDGTMRNGMKKKIDNLMF